MLCFFKYVFRRTIIFFLQACCLSVIDMPLLNCFAILLKCQHLPSSTYNQNPFLWETEGRYFYSVNKDTAHKICKCFCPCLYYTDYSLRCQAFYGKTCDISSIVHSVCKISFSHCVLSGILDYESLPDHCCLHLYAKLSGPTKTGTPAITACVAGLTDQLELHSVSICRIKVKVVISSLYLFCSFNIFKFILYWNEHLMERNNNLSICILSN